MSARVRKYRYILNFVLTNKSGVVNGVKNEISITNERKVRKIKKNKCNPLDYIFGLISLVRGIHSVMSYIQTHVKTYIVFRLCNHVPTL